MASLAEVRRSFIITTTASQVRQSTFRTKVLPRSRSGSGAKIGRAGLEKIPARGMKTLTDPKLKLSNHSNWVRCVRWSPDGDQLATARSVFCGHDCSRICTDKCLKSARTSQYVYFQHPEAKFLGERPASFTFSCIERNRFERFTETFFQRSTSRLGLVCNVLAQIKQASEACNRLPGRVFR